MASGGTMLCPVCDATLEAGAKRCKSCNTDLTLFDIDQDGGLDLDRIKVRSKEDIDAFLRSLSDERGNVDAEKLKEIARSTEFGGTGEKGAVVFECPACGAEVDAAAAKCPSCGAVFMEGTEVGCPSCGATVPADATSCPECGTVFTAPKAPEPLKKVGPDLRPALEAARAARAHAAETPEVHDRKALYKELPKLVGEVKPMLLVGRELGIDMVDGKKLINDAIAFGKSRDIEKAVSLVREAKRSLHAAFTDAVVRLLEGPTATLANGEAGAAEADISAGLTEAIQLLRDGDYREAHQTAKAVGARSSGGAPVPPGAAASQAISATESALRDAEVLGVAPRDAASLLGEARSALSSGRSGEAARAATRARDALLRSLPPILAAQMKSARDQLLNIRAKGGDLTRPIGLLKQASIHQKRQEYESALRYLRLFHDEIGRLPPE